MPTHVAFFRGLNLGRRRLTNDELRAAVEASGFDDVEVYQASGNVVFSAVAGPADEETRLERGLAEALGYEVHTFVRTMDETRAVAEREPFDDTEDAKVHVMFLKELVETDVADAVEALGNDDDRFAVAGREVYWFRRGGLMDATVEERTIDEALDRRLRTMRTQGTVQRLVKKFGCVALLLLGMACGGTEAGDGGAADGELAERTPEAVSLFGEPLYAMEDTTGAVAAADARLAEAPDDVERIIEAGRVRRNFWQYRDAMTLYSRAHQLAPDDWRPLRFRGHRHISLRQFGEAIEDLEASRDRAPLNWDVAYHLGLAYFLAGRFDDAADEYLRCMHLADDPAAAAAATDDFRSCSRNGDDPESRVAMTEWAVRAALRAGRGEVADSLLSALPEEMDVSENVAYWYDLQFYRGAVEADELLNPGPDAPYRRETVGYGIANWWIAVGDTARAEALLEELVEDPWWPGFGRIAAEVELHRIQGGAGR